MMKKIWILALLPLLFSCGGNSTSTSTSLPETSSEENECYALFMYNYPRATSTSPNGNPENFENMLYLKMEINPGEVFAKPEDPTRNNYKFEGWFKERSCIYDWDFTKDTSEVTVYLYAKWGLEQSEEYVPPEYVYPERIITDMNYRVTGILNEPINEGTCKLPQGAINRLEAHPEDVSFAINYERKEDVSLTVATYDVDKKEIHLEVSSGETFDIKISLLIGLNVDGTYETKAQKYEANGGNIENYQIALAGSSSMENWSTSHEDMMPIETFNHGIGGTTVEQWTDALFERLVLPYSPKAVVYYVGVNDIINNSKNGTKTAQNLVWLFDKTHRYLPNTQIFYVLINKLPGFPHFQKDFDTANNGAIEYANAHPYVTCIDAGKGLLKENGLPSAANFITDGLHMSKYGYTIWGKAVKDAVINWLG